MWTCCIHLCINTLNFTNKVIIITEFLLCARYCCKCFKLVKWTNAISCSLTFNSSITLLRLNAVSSVYHFMDLRYQFFLHFSTVMAMLSELLPGAMVLVYFITLFFFFLSLFNTLALGSNTATARAPCPAMRLVWAGLKQVPPGAFGTQQSDTIVVEDGKGGEGERWSRGERWIWSGEGGEEQTDVNDLLTPESKM